MFDAQHQSVGALRSLVYKKKLFDAVFQGTPSTESISDPVPFDKTGIAKLEKKPGKDFVILNITDPHFSDYDFPRKKSKWIGEKRRTEARPTSRKIRKLVRLVKPDLITVTGDMVCYKTRYAIDRFTRLMDGFDTPWAPIFGNHDHEGNCDKDFLAERMLQSPTCLLRKGPKEAGVGNYVLTICENNHAVGTLLMADTNTPDADAFRQWVTCATEGVRRLFPGDTNPIALVTHKPHEKFSVAYFEAWDEETKTLKNPTVNKGERGEKECPGFDFFDTVKTCGIDYTICGHDHLNDYSLMYEGVRLLYTLKVGEGSGAKADMMGGTVITLKGDGTFHAYHQFMECRDNQKEELF